MAKVINWEFHLTVNRVFDQLWNNVNSKNYFPNRQDAYNLLSNKMNKNVRLTHIAMFSEQECKQVIRICEKFAEDRIKNDFIF